MFFAVLLIRNWKELRKLIDKVDKVYQEIA